MIKIGVVCCNLVPFDVVCGNLTKFGAILVKFNLMQSDAPHQQVYRPRSPEEICGNPATMSALSKWLGEWKDKRRRGKPGGDSRPTPDSGEDSGEESEVTVTLTFYLYSAVQRSRSVTP